MCPPVIFPFLLEYSPRVFNLFRPTIWSFKSIRALSLPSLQVVPYPSAEIFYRLLPSCSLLSSLMAQYWRYSSVMYILASSDASGRLVCAMLLHNLQIHVLTEKFLVFVRYYVVCEQAWRTGHNRLVPFCDIEYSNPLTSS